MSMIRKDLLWNTFRSNLSSYTQRFNKINNCDGQLFKGRFKSIFVDAESYLLELIRYIHRNPLESAIVDHMDQYTWSSHKAYLSEAKKWEWLNRKHILSFFSRNRGESIRRYKQFISKETPEEINQILARKKWPAVIGSRSFILLGVIHHIFFINDDDCSHIFPAVCDDDSIINIGGGLQKILDKLWSDTLASSDLSLFIYTYHESAKFLPNN